MSANIGFWPNIRHFNPHKMEDNSSINTWRWVMVQFYSILSRALNRRHRMGLVGTVLVSVHQEFQGSQESQDPQDQLVPQDHLAIMGLKDPWAHEETKAMKVLVEGKVCQAPRDLKGPWVQQVHRETRVMQALVEAKVLQAPRELQGLWDVTGNSAFLRIWMTTGTQDWLR